MQGKDVCCQAKESGIFPVKPHHLPNNLFGGQYPEECGQELFQERYIISGKLQDLELNVPFQCRKDICH